MVLILIFGFLFGAILQYANLNRYNVISGLAILENFTVAKAIATAIGIGAILLSIEIGLGFASYHVKPFLLAGIVLGGLIFGTGMAILGYCPGTLAISAAEGSVDAVVGIVGGLCAGLVYTLLVPSLKEFSGPDLGTISLQTIIGSNFLFFLLTVVIGALFVAVAFWLHKKDRIKNYRWLYAGIALAILNPLIFLTSTWNRPIGASTAFPYLADVVTGTTQNAYFTTIQKSGNWEIVFLLGAFMAGLIISLIKKEFRLTLIHTNWKRFKGSSAIKRVAWAFTGGFLLITGARMAGGCTSGHILSGGMQLSLSSIVFALFVFAGLLITGHYFYKKKYSIPNSSD
jgi:hypothetical protein